MAGGISTAHQTSQSAGGGDSGSERMGILALFLFVLVVFVLVVFILFVFLVRTLLWHTAFTNLVQRFNFNGQVT